MPGLLRTGVGLLLCASTWSCGAPVEQTLSTPAPEAETAARISRHLERFGIVKSNPLRQYARTTDVEIASGEVRVRDAASGIEVRFAPEGARAGAAFFTDDAAIWTDALGPGADWILEKRSNGVEDFVVIPETGRRELVYRIDVSSVAGLRLVAQSLEFLDGTGDPRLRVRAPFVVDANRARHPTELALEGCHADHDPRAPWGRAVTPPGSGSCSLVIRWQPDLPTPVLVDPVWDGTNSMTAARHDHRALAVATGRVLVVGGDGSNGSTPLASTEYFENGSWAAGPPLKSARAAPTATLLLDRVVVAGGVPGALNAEVLELNVPGAAWQVVPMLTPRSNHSAIAINGKVLVCGGVAPVAIVALSSCEAYDPASDSFVPQPGLSGPRMQGALAYFGPSATQALFAGGLSQAINPVVWVSALEVFPNAVGGWGYASGFLSQRANPTATSLPSGNVLVAGGDTIGVPKNAVELVLHAGGVQGMSGMTVPRVGHLAAALDPDRVLFAGGFTQPAGAGATVSTEIFRVSSNTSIQTDDLGEPRARAAIAPLGNGAFLVSGGKNGAQQVLASAEIFSLLPNGEKCDVSVECKSSSCVDGFCCDSSCAGKCEACSLLKTGTADGQCAPVTQDTDPDGECNDEGVLSCQGNGVCDGSGQCGFYPVGTVCLKATCNAATSQWYECAGPGECTTFKLDDCENFACVAGVCEPDCTTHADCAATAFCDGTTCKAKLVDGVACRYDAQCDHGFCVDGVCCVGPCTGQCESCNEASGPGECVRIHGDPRNGRPSCEAASSPDLPCTARQCDGITPGECAGWALSNVVCLPGACVDGVETLEATCDGSGLCKEPASTPCGAFVCADAFHCATLCTKNADCADGAVCDPGSQKCVQGAYCEGNTAVGIDGQKKECSPFVCGVSGECLKSCASADDCVEGMVCDFSGACMAPGASGEDESGCGCRTAGGRTGSIWPFIVGFVALGFRRKHPGRSR